MHGVPRREAVERARDLLAFREGWALYAERLGHEMGVYRDAYETFGSLSTEMWRACRKGRMHPAWVRCGRP